MAFDDFNPRYRKLSEVASKPSIRQGAMTVSPSDHQVFIEFNKPIDKEVFQKWWHMEGYEAFKEYWNNYEVQI